jgi:hypothetical protein
MKKKNFVCKSSNNRGPVVLDSSLRQAISFLKDEVFVLSSAKGLVIRNNGLEFLYVDNSGHVVEKNDSMSLSALYLALHNCDFGLLEPSCKLFSG